MSDPLIPPGYVRILVEHKYPTSKQVPRDLIEAVRLSFAGESPAPALRRHRLASSLIPDDEYVAWLPPDPIQVANTPDLFPPRNPLPTPIPFPIWPRVLRRGYFKPPPRGRIPTTIDGHRIFSDPAAGTAKTTCPSSRYIGDTSTVHAKLDTALLAANGLDGSGVTIAIVDTGISERTLTRRIGHPPATDPTNSWPGLLTSKAFHHRIGHGTMCAFDALIAAPDATLVDVPMLLSRAPDEEHSTKGTIGAAIQAYTHLLYKWFGQTRPTEALVISNSWGIYHPSLDTFPPGHPGRFIDNPKHIFHDVVHLLALLGADIVFAGNNCGADCPSPTCLSKTSRMIMGSSAYSDVLTVAGCNVRNERVGYSSKGPSIQHMPQRKPDITAYTHFLGSKTARSFLPDAGVSAACAVAAGCVAALRTRVPPKDISPAGLFDVLKRTARRGVGGGPGGRWNADYGYGIIDPVKAARKLGLIR